METLNPHFLRFTSMMSNSMVNIAKKLFTIELDIMVGWAASVAWIYPYTILFGTYKKDDIDITDDEPHDV